MIGETQGFQLDDRFWGYYCSCRWPYWGKDCENVSPIQSVCAGNQCQNGATCGLRTYALFGGYFYADADYDASTGGPYEYQADPYTCQCAAGFFGQYCENTIQLCGPNACLNNGVCSNSNNQRITCACPCGYAGDRCELMAANADAESLASFAGNGRGGVGYHLDFCSNNPCVNDGTCLGLPNGQEFFCACKSGWAGTYCERRVRSAATSVVPSVLVAVAAMAAVVMAVRH